jgi:hypothetical protein
MISLDCSFARYQSTKEETERKSLESYRWIVAESVTTKIKQYTNGPSNKESQRCHRAAAISS